MTLNATVLSHMVVSIHRPLSAAHPGAGRRPANVCLRQPNAGGEPRPMAGATQERKLLGVGFRVEPMVTQPAPPQTRTCVMNASGSSGARGSAQLWRITVLPDRPLRCCGRFWVWAKHRLPAASGISPSQSHSCCYADSTSIATPSPHSDGRSPAEGSCLESRRTESARVASRTASDTGMAEAHAGCGDTLATTPSGYAGAVSWLFCV